MKNLSLQQNYPNPFNPATTISYPIPRDGNVKLVIFDVTGAEARILENSWKRAGAHKSYWDGKNQQGELVASGIYFYRLSFGKKNIAKKMILLR